MGRNVQFQHLRGSYAQLLTLQSGGSPLAIGEVYFATDTLNVYIGQPSASNGFTLVGGAAGTLVQYDGGSSATGATNYPLDLDMGASS